MGDDNDTPWKGIPPVRDYGGCKCDFCTGKKRWDDNWCARCGDVRLAPPKWWENMDVCDACDAAVRAEEAAEAAP